jgi:hypothetical protein
MKNFFKVSVTLSIIWLAASFAFPYLQQQRAKLPSANEVVSELKQKAGV